MQIGIAQLVGGLIAIALLIGGAFEVGTKWHADAGGAEAAGAASALDPSDASSTDEEITVPKEAPLYKVLRVVDGDTIAVEIDGKSESLRMIGIDTPEINDSRTGVQCFGKEASEETKSLLTGKKVRLEKDPTQGERDKYKRILAYVFREDGLFINKTLVVEGYAHEYTYDLPYKYQEQFKAAEVSAREGEKGLWSREACPEPAPKRPAKSSSSSKPTSNASQTAAAATALPPTQQPVQQFTPLEAAGSLTGPVQMMPMPQMQTQQTTEAKVEAPPAPKQEPPPPPPMQSSPDLSGYTCSANTYNCSDFKTQKEAQAVYDKCGGVANDIHKLDKNKDGHPCDSLP